MDETLWGEGCNPTVDSLADENRKLKAKLAAAEEMANHLEFIAISADHESRLGPPDCHACIKCGAAKALAKWKEANNV